MSYPTPTQIQNEAALLEFIRQPYSSRTIQLAAEKTSKVVPRVQAKELHRFFPPAPSKTPPVTSLRNATDPYPREASTPPLEKFIGSVIERTRVRVTVLISSLVYLDRLKTKLPNILYEPLDTPHRIFLGCLILAAKFILDGPPENRVWAEHCFQNFNSSVTEANIERFGFSIAEINSKERELLESLDWDLFISPDDLYQTLEPLLAPIRERQMRQAIKARSDCQRAMSHSLSIQH